MLEKHKENIFETSEASLVVLSIASVKLHLPNHHSQPCFLSILLKINRVPLINNINDCTKFEGNR